MSAETPLKFHAIWWTKLRLVWRLNASSRLRSRASSRWKNAEAFSTREAALDAYAGRLDDDRTGATPEAEDRYCRLAEQLAEGAARPKPLSPTYADGHRWPQPLKPPRTVWRLTVSYWRIATAARPLDAPQARLARRSMHDLAPDTLQAISRAPMRPIKPQQPLDIGLFEIRPPDAPHIVMPDE